MMTQYSVGYLCSGYLLRFMSVNNLHLDLKISSFTEALPVGLSGLWHFGTSDGLPRGRHDADCSRS